MTDRGKYGVKPAPESAQRVDVQGMRGIAVLLVVLFHAGLPVPGGFVGVDVFFVISGFVITGMLVRELDGTGRLDLRRFYARRVRRLLPALAVMLLFVAAASLPLLSPLGSQQLTSRTGIAAAIFVANAVLFAGSGGYFDAAAETNPLLHTWTLAVEEQFYVIFPLLLLLTWRLTANRQAPQLRAARTVVAATLLVSFALCVWLTYSTGLPLGQLAYNRRFAFYASPTRAWEFAAGALIALTQAGIAARVGRGAATVLGLGGAVTLALTAALLSEADPFPGYFALAPVIGTALLIVAGTGPSHGVVTAALQSKSLVWVGDVSYSWYLWHWPFIVFLLAIFPDAPVYATTAVALVSLLPAWASYQFVESRFRFDKTIVGRKAFRLAVVCCLVPIVAFIALAASTRLYGAKVEQLRADYQPHLDVGCQGNMPGDQDTVDTCTWLVDDSRGRVVLLGDSNAGHFAEPVRAAANEAGYDFVLATYGGCLTADLLIEYKTPYDTTGCREFAEAWSDDILHDPPVAVVLASAAGSYLSSDEVSLVSPDGTVARSEEAREAAYKAGLESRIAPWSDAGIPTLVVHQVPQFRHFDLGGCPLLRIYANLASCGRELDRSEAVEYLTPGTTAETEAVKDMPSTATLQLLDQVCGPEICSTMHDGRFAYRDGAHLSVPFAMTLEPVFRRALDALW